MQAEGVVHHTSAPLGATVAALKQRVCQELSLNARAATLSLNGEQPCPPSPACAGANAQAPAVTRWNAVLTFAPAAPGKPLHDAQRLHSVGATVGGQLRVALTLGRTGDASYKMPDVLEVVVPHGTPPPPARMHVHTRRRADAGGGRRAAGEGGDVRAVRVVVERAADGKPYLGGYRHKLNGIVYHHASTQTPVQRKRDWERRPARFHRETQTAVEVARSQQTQRECGTQMARPDLYVEGREDRTLAPGAYFTADELDELKLQKAIVMQRYWRGYKVRAPGRWHPMHARVRCSRLRVLVGTLAGERDA